MLETLRNAWRIPDLRKKILYTLMLLLIFRLGGFVPLPGVNREHVATLMETYDALGFLDLLSGGALAKFTLFALGISPYITASIVMQLLTVAIPKLESMAKEGEEGRKKLNQWTRYAGIALAFIEGIGVILGLRNQVMLPNSGWLDYITIGVSLAAGAAICMWIGERITEKGVGNGISLLIFVGIISRLPVIFLNWIKNTIEDPSNFWAFPPVLIGIILIIAAIVFIDMGQRRIPVQYAKRVVGRKMYGGQSSHIPLKVNASGVMPLIFAMSLVSFPQVILQFWPTSGIAIWWSTYLGTGSWIYTTVFVLLIIGFAYFYSTISFNPIELSKNMQQNGGFIPGVRPGKPTSDYLARICSRLTLVGAIFLALVAMVPMLFNATSQNIQFAFSATGLLILVSVSLETTKQLESQMLMRHYKGFLK